ncbi:MAE_28990/MAE_18760 family HEPN-like nuclease [Novosphingobium sp. NPDC080210]|jgi:hypothetical protein|uniref:MAE_28990/MAE_18760 family HEPN-like nuclease n=1 Tax=Novosphingobium sp. NPDC080210 TaxID=3390596 RepID=UPI003D05FFF5
MKIRTLSEFQDALDKEMAWRVKEIADLNSAVTTAPSATQNTMIRAGIALTYAHWEGFIKNSSEHYLAFISGKRVPLEDLKDSFVAISIRAQIEKAVESQRFDQNIKVVDILRNQMRERFNFTLSSSIDTQSNLSSSVFKNIVGYLDLKPDFYEPKFNFIDESLLKRRNKVAHGEYLDVDKKQWKNISREVLNLLRAYKTDLENSASLSSFMKT